MCFFFSSRRRHTRCALVTGVQTCSLPISVAALVEGLARDPLAALALRSALMRSMAVVLEASGLTSEGIVGALRQKSLAALHASVLRQIGRASCRERGCQCVSISVVAVSLKKKKIIS